MRLFVDASALVAIISGEPEREALVERIAAAGETFWSALSCWETVSGLRSSHKISLEAAERETEQTATTFALRLVPIAADELRVALGAYRRFGKSSGHRAKLNFGDCFAYACAKTNDARLLYKGGDFAHTDLA